MIGETSNQSAATLIAVWCSWTWMETLCMSARPESAACAARERNHPAIERYPILTDTDLLLLCYPEDSATLTNGLRRERLFREKKALE